MVNTKEFDNIDDFKRFIRPLSKEEIIQIIPLIIGNAIDGYHHHYLVIYERETV
jgi:hypothetical protein